jgi:hypothetical protein
MSNGISTDSNDPYDNTPMNVHDNSSHNYSNSHHHLYNPFVNTQSHSNPSVSTISNAKAPKSRKKRKPNDLNASFDDDAPTKARKRKSMPYNSSFPPKKEHIFFLEKGTEETEKFVEHSLQQLRDLPMLTSLEPSIDINNELSLSLSFDLPDKKHSYQGEFGHVFIENIQDFYRPQIKPIFYKPMFRIRIQENKDEPAKEFLEPTAKSVWHKIDCLRRQHGLVKMFSIFVSGEDLYGLTVN